MTNSASMAEHPLSLAGMKSPARQAEELLSRVAVGDQRAFASLYSLFAAKVYQVVHGVIRDTAQAEEVTQEVFLAIWDCARKFDATRGSVSGYIALLAHSKAVERVRSSQAARTRDHKYSASHLDRNDLHDPVSEGALLADERIQIHVAMLGLTVFQREAIMLHYFDQRTYIETGLLLGISVTAVKARVRSGVVQLRCLMAAA